MIGTILCGLMVIAAVDDGPSWEVPYRRIATNHVMVRARIDGKGPYHFIVDSGAPALIVAKSVAEELGVAKDEKSWGILPTFAIEGGPTLKQERARIEDMFQLEGMNGLGIAGVKLHGVIGYSVLSHYRLEFDFTGDSMTWTALDYEPKPFRSVMTRDEAKLADMTWVGTLAKGLGKLVGKPIVEPLRRGSVGIELDDSDEGVRVAHVLNGSPAEAAGIRAGDLIQRVGIRRVKSIAELLRATANVSEEADLELEINRDDELISRTVRTEKGI